jgi:hypothetical protein
LLPHNIALSDVTMEDETVENVIDLMMDSDYDTVIVVNKIEDVGDDVFAETEGEEDTGKKVAIEKDYDRDLFSDTEDEDGEDAKPEAIDMPGQEPNEIGWYMDTMVEEDLGAAIEHDMDQTEYSEEHGQIVNVVDEAVYFYSDTHAVYNSPTDSNVAGEHDLNEKWDTNANEETAGTKDETKNIEDRAGDTVPEEQVFMVHTKEEVFDQWNANNSEENWLVDSGATTHVAMNTKNMTNILIATEGQYVRVGNNATMPATAIGDLTLHRRNGQENLPQRCDGCSKFCEKPYQCWTFDGKWRERF